MKTSKPQGNLSSRDLSKSVKDDVEAFLKSGKKIQMIPSGVSGQTDTPGKKHIVITKRR